ncbi:MAG: hypothetical protein KF876_07405 [Nitrospira sp.]|nr:hypothetical protein [Nitrospira sp.]
MRVQGKKTDEAKTIEEAGEAFLDELRRHHFGCDFERDIIPWAPVEGRLDRSANLAGDAFVAEVLRRFSNDRLYVELT